MNQTAPKEKNSTVFWWMGWIVLTIVTFFVSCYFWTGFIAKKVGAINQPGVAILWVALVFGTWMIMLIPLIIVMYNKVDRVYEDTRMTREEATYEKLKKALKIKTVSVPTEKRELRQELVKKLKGEPETMKRGHLANLILKDGRRIKNVFILDRREILGIYEAGSMDFVAADIMDLEIVNIDKGVVFKTENWLRLDA